jgi:hypothetical protein
MDALYFRGPGRRVNEAFAEEVAEIARRARAKGFAAQRVIRLSDPACATARPRALR